MSDSGISVIDEIYEAAAVPELWPRILDKLSTIPDALDGVLFATNSQSTKWTTSDIFAEKFSTFVNSGWAARNTRTQRLAAKQHAGFVVDHDLFTDEELEAEPVYVEVFRNIGIGWAAGTFFRMPSGDILVFSLERAFDKGPISRDAVEKLDRLRPHLGRAGLLAWRLGLERSQATARALEAIGLPASVLHNSGRPIACNSLFEALMPEVFQDRSSGLAIADRSADMLLQDTLDRLRSGWVGAGASIPVIGSDNRPPLIIHLLPVKGAAHDIFNQGSFVLIVMKVDHSSVPGAEVIAGLFDLTPAESRIARGIAEGRSIRDIGARSGVSTATIRTQLKSVLAKTGMHRQAELASLLSGTEIPFKSISTPPPEGSR